MGLKLQSVSGGSVELNSPITTNNYVVTMPAQSGTVMMAENYQPSFKNRIINGAMMIDQRNAGASVTPADTSYTLDRWKFYCSQPSKVSSQQNAGSVTPPAGYSNYLGYTSLSAYSVGVSDYFIGLQIIEGYNVVDFNWGTANAQPVTLSFWVRSSLTGTFGGAFINGANNRSCPFSYTISSANTWEQKSVTVAGDTAGSWLVNNGKGLEIRFSLGAGSTYSGTAGAWASANYVSATGATSVVGTNGATFYITGVQLEKGSTATSFDYRPYGTELALCQRYYWQMVKGSTQMVCNSMYYTANAVYGSITFPVTMRTPPSLSASSGTNYYIVERGGATNFLTSLFTLKTNTVSTGIGNTSEASGTIGYAGWIASFDAASSIGFSAEL